MSSKEKQRKVNLSTLQENGIPGPGSSSNSPDTGGSDHNHRNNPDTPISENGAEAPVNVVKCPSPSYVTINVDTPEVDGAISEDAAPTPYPVYTVGDSTIYGTTGSAQFYTSTPHAGITYAQGGDDSFMTLQPETSVTEAANTSDTLLGTGGVENTSIWLDEENEEANYLNMGLEDDTLGQGENPLEDLVIMICMNKIAEKVSRTAFPSNDLLATLKSCPITVQWLLDNFERADGVSLPRSTMYYHYIKHCKDHQLDPVNAASFGKLIRSVFLGLRTRRLGTRGNSKYHYYGIRLKPESPLNLVDEKTIDELMSTRGNGNGIYHPSPPRGVAISPSGNSHSAAKKAKLSKWEHSELLNGITSLEASAIQHYLGESAHVMNSLPDLDLQIPLPEDLTPDDLIVFLSLYRELCSQLLEDTVNFQLSDFQRRWRVFFRAEGSTGYVLEQQQQYESILPKPKLHALCALRPIQEYVRQTDFQLYQHMSNILLPDVLRHIPGVMTQTIRNFAKVVEGFLAAAMTGFPEELIAVKLTALKAFGQTLRRYTSLNHVAQAARAVLENETQINQMLNDLNRVDFSCVEEQAAWVCDCNLDIVPDLESDFKGALAQHQSLEEWATWLESVVDRILRPHENTPKYTSVARYFLLKWSFYSSLVIRDLTLRSAASFGSFHLLRLLIDEYMFYLIENRVARAINTLPIAVMGKKLMNPLHPDSAEGGESSGSFENATPQNSKLLPSALSISP